MRLALAVVLSSTLAATTTTVALADDGKSDKSDKKEAQVLFTQGVKLAESGDLKGALAAFRSAHEKFPNYRVLYNVGQLCGRLADPACTVRAYEQYLREGGSEINAKRRAEVEAELATARKSVAMLTITTNVTGAEITIDEAPAGTAPLSGPVPVNPGSRAIVVRHDGKTAERTVKAIAGETPSVDLEIAKEAAAPPKAEEPTPETSADRPKPYDRSERKIPVVPWAVTGGLAVITLVSGVLAASAYATYKDKQESFPTTKDALEDAQGSARTLFLFTAVFGGLTVASAGVAAWFTLRPPASGSADVKVGLGPRGIALAGSF